MSTVLCLDDDAIALDAARRTLERFDHRVLSAATVSEALRALSTEVVDLVLTDYQMPGLTGLDFLSLIRGDGIDLPVIMVTGFGSVDHAVIAMRAGVVDYLAKPYSPRQLEIAIERALEYTQLRRENEALRQEVANLRGDRAIAGDSLAMRRVLETIRVAAPTRATVLVQGETGTGKELVARALHEQSDRRTRPFIALNCAALPSGLVESILFGHEKGAFTGAAVRQLGAFERAHTGTLLLDEVSEMPLGVQAKLLRVLQEQEFERVGGAVPVHVDVRVIATTHRDLAHEAASGRFRPDLFYRLNGVPIVVPPLRERLDDIPVLVSGFAARTAERLGRPAPELTREALDLLRRHSWPGNVRELQHAVERAVILARDVAIAPMHFSGKPFGLMSLVAEPSFLRSADTVTGEPQAFVLKTHRLALRDIEAAAVRAALDACGGNRTRAAALLGITPKTLSSKLRGRERRADVVERAGAGGGDTRE